MLRCGHLSIKRKVSVKTSDRGESILAAIRREHKTAETEFSARGCECVSLPAVRMPSLAVRFRDSAQGEEESDGGGP